MKSFVSKLQIGKSGLTDGFILSLKNALKDHSQVRISLLKSSNRDRENIKSTLEDIKRNIESEFKCRYKIIGFTIIISKLRNLKKI